MKVSQLLPRLGFLALAACQRGAEPRAARRPVPRSAPAPVSVSAFHPPSFATYAVADSFRGRPARPDLASHPLGRRYRTVIRDDAAGGPNFAGHYRLVAWGCVSPCQMSVVVDERTGRIYDGLHTQMGLAFQRQSALVVADPPDSAEAAFGDSVTRVNGATCVTCGIPAAYVWRRDHFEPVGPGEHPHLLNDTVAASGKPSG